VAQAILWTDLVFTAGGGALLVISGILLIRARGYVIAETPWLVHGITALGASTLVWLTVLLPDQLRLERADPADDATVRRVFLRWTIVGWTATAILFYGLWTMVTGRVP
jgi:threonine/homoserine/homoserine lactone efflux protein